MNTILTLITGAEPQPDGSLVVSTLSGKHFHLNAEPDSVQWGLLAMATLATEGPFVAPIYPSALCKEAS